VRKEEASPQPSPKGEGEETGGNIKAKEVKMEPFCIAHIVMRL